MVDLSSPVRRLLNTVLVVTGALVIGQAFHESLVTGEAELLSTRILLLLVGGSVAVAIGYFVRPVPGRSKGGEIDEEMDDRERSQGEFDADLSPVGEQLETVENPERSDGNA